MGLVAIVGRPNVGKSTLFNRIIEERHAIVEGEPGVTRDRLYARAEWGGKHFDIVDTGGIVPQSDDVFEKAIREQAMLAIEEADVILFAVDGRDGITPVDETIASMLRSGKKPVVLVVNKCDNAISDMNSAEFYALGLGDPFPISALNGRSTGDFLDAVIEHLDQGSDQEDTNALLGKDRMVVTPVAGTTRDAIDSVLTYYGEQVVLIDTAGLRRRSQIKESVELYSTMRTSRAIDRCDVAVVVIDAVQGLEAQDKRIISEVEQARKGIIIALNKWDLIEKDTKTADMFMQKIRDELRTLDYVPIITISAVTKQRITKLVEMAKQIQARRCVRIPTHELNEELIAMLERTPPPSVKGRDLRINYVTQVSTEPPLFAFFLNFPELLPEAYKRFIERQLRNIHDLEGVPISFVFRKKSG
jgi:GTP-binding protein